MANTVLGLAVTLGPICLALVVLLTIELVDRVQSPRPSARVRNSSKSTAHRD